MRKILSISKTISILLATAFALAITAGANPGGYSVTPSIPENQNQGATGYFDLVVAPGQQQELKLWIANDNEEEALMLLALYTVTTNLNGIIDFSAPGQSDETLRHSFSDIAALDCDEITIPPGETREITVSLSVPDEAFAGILLGAIRVIREPTEREIAESDMIINRYSYVIPIKLSQSDAPVETEFMLGELTTELVNRRAAITAGIRNPQPASVKGVEASAQIFIAGEEEPLFQVSDFVVDFAPNSIFPFTMVDSEGYGIRAGYYTAKIQLVHNGKTWEFEKEFEITPQEAGTINGGAVNQLQNPPQEPIGNSEINEVPLWAKISIMVTGVAVLVSATVVMIMIKKSQQRAHAAFTRQRFAEMQKSNAAANNRL